MAESLVQLSDLQYLMGQLGPASPDIHLIVQQSDDRWQVEFEGGLSLHASWRARLSCHRGARASLCAAAECESGADRDLGRAPGAESTG